MFNVDIILVFLFLFIIKLFSYIVFIDLIGIETNTNPLQNVHLNDQKCSY